MPHAGATAGSAAENIMNASEALKRLAQIAASQADPAAVAAEWRRTSDIAASIGGLLPRGKFIVIIRTIRSSNARAQPRPAADLRRGGGARRLLGRGAAARPHPTGGEPANPRARAAARRAADRPRRQARAADSC